MGRASSALRLRLRLARRVRVWGAVTSISATSYTAARWLLAPIYFGLAFALLALAIKFFQEIFHILPAILSLGEAELILKLLSLIDMALVGGLLVMVAGFLAAVFWRRFLVVVSGGWFLGVVFW